ncbi:putative rRNA-processing protein EBP2-like protein [Hibiscus syriacus]|uniref:rRNA-processing protein EBP2-like protein n=1 Tax=Hibiscus syriacus TaxID=106335 RepID=A0A6A2WS86_HIBSY|nr:putative rRNA-processing protein EBP2-like protein [Hibiscus syriacus]
MKSYKTVVTTDIVYPREELQIYPSLKTASFGEGFKIPKRPALKGQLLIFIFPLLSLAEREEKLSRLSLDSSNRRKADFRLATVLRRRLLSPTTVTGGNGGFYSHHGAPLGLVKEWKLRGVEHLEVAAGLFWKHEAAPRRASGNGGWELGFRNPSLNVTNPKGERVAFYMHALEGTGLAFEKFQSMGLPFLRPPDYYVEMVKTNAHMQKVKGKLLAQKKQIEEAEERRKAREAKRIAKEVQAEKMKERAKQKKQEIEEVKSFGEGKALERSSKNRPGVSRGNRSGGKARQGGGKFNNKNKKNREFQVLSSGSEEGKA